MDPSNPSFSDKLNFYLSRAEQALLGIALIGLVLKYAHQPWTMILTVSLAGLAIVFFLSAFMLSAQSNLTENAPLGFKELLTFSIAPKILGISSAVSAIGILFYLQGLKGYQQMTLIGGIAITFGLLSLGYGFMTYTKNIRTTMPMVYRAIPLGCIDAYIFLQNL